MRSHFLKLTSIFVAAALLVWAAAEQPLPYSHKTHLKMGLKCTECHTMPGKGEAATFPPETKCMQCHASVKTESPHIQKLTEYAKKKEAVPWVRLYRVPEFVWFSHKVHTKVVDCARCHGPVAERDVMTKEKPIDMNSCMSCHDEHKASNECNLCHNPA